MEAYDTVVGRECPGFQFLSQTEHGIVTFILEDVATGTNIDRFPLHLPTPQRQVLTAGVGIYPGIIEYPITQDVSAGMPQQTLQE